MTLSKGFIMKFIQNIVMCNLLLGTCSSSMALDIIYEPRKPYIEEISSTIEGLVATPLIQSLNKADITYTLKNRPSKRHLLEIKANKKAVCAVGWFKNSERQSYGKYTKALYQDKPMGIITYVNSDIKDNITLKALFANKEWSILVKDSFSYGKQIDEKLKTTSQRIYKVSTTNDNMVLHIIRKRADFMFLSYEEALSILNNERFKNKLQFIKIKEIPQGNKRYLICSQKVDDALITSINRHLK